MKKEAKKRRLLNDTEYFYCLNLNERQTDSIFKGCILIIGVVMLTLNLLTPLAADDFFYMYRTGSNERISSFFHIGEMLWNLYFDATGRIPAHGIAMLLLWIGKPLANIANACAYMVLTYVIYRLIHGKGTESPLCYLFIHLTLWFFTPAYGQVIFWLTGAANYMWTLLCVLFFLRDYHVHMYIHMDDSRSRESSPGVCLKLFLLGILAGWCNENLSGAALLMTIGYVILYKIYKIRVPRRSIFGIVGCFTGLLIQILSPGNAMRLRRVSVDDTRDLYEKLSVQFSASAKMLMEENMWLVYVFIILFVIGIFQNRDVKKLAISALWFLGGLASNFAMALSVSYAYRCLFATTVFLIIACGMAYDALKISAIQQAAWGIMGCATIMFLIQLSLVYIDLIDTNRAYHERMNLVAQVKASGAMEATLPIIHPKTKQNALWEPVFGTESFDLSVDPNDSMNVLFAREYGLSTIIGI